MTDNNIVAAMLVALTVSTAAMIALRPVAHAIGFIDLPGGRKFHSGGVPVVGGVAIFVGMFAAFTMIPNVTYDFLSLFVASSILVLIGLVDEKYPIPAATRISIQVAAVLVMVYGANLSLVSIGDPFGSGEAYMGRFTLVFTGLVTVSMINAYNFIDGIDGLTGTLALIAFLALSIAAGPEHPAMAVAMVAAAAVIGFLFFNLPVSLNRKVRCFMGDAGSALLGFTIVWVALGLTQGAERSISPVHALWFAALPVFDFFTCFVSRIRKGKTPFTPGRDHIHHVLRRGGFDHRETLIFLVVLQLVYASIGLVAHYAEVPDTYLFTAWCVVGFSQRLVIRKIARAHRARSLQPTPR